MKKSQGLSLNTIIITAIVLIVLVILWGIFTGRMEPWISPEEPKQSKHEMVCQNLEKNNSIYWEIINTRNEIQYGFGVMIKDMDGTKIVSRSWDNDGVVCELPAEMCVDGLYCVNVNMLIPINYTQWEEWYYE